MASYYIRGLEGDLRIEDSEGKVYSKGIKTRLKAIDLLEKRMIKDRLNKYKKVELSIEK